MSTKKVLALGGSILILGAGFLLAGEKAPVTAKNQVAETLKQGAESPFQARVLFVDENGDGICDLMRDHDGDGIPNSQDPNYEGPKDGSGNQYRRGDANGTRQSSNRQNGSDGHYQLGNRKGFLGDSTMNRQSFRNNRGDAGNGNCDNTGPKGNTNRTGKK